MIKHAYVLLVWGLFFICEPVRSNETAHIKSFKLYNGGWSNPIQAYNLALVQAALEASKSTWGPYTLDLYPHELSEKRADIELGEGEKINLRLDSYRVDTARQSKHHSVVLSTRLNVMGLRALIVKNSSVNAFATVNTTSDFIGLKPGQGFDWPDVKIYEAHGIEVVKAPNFSSIIAMLERGRFDFFPLSFIEAYQALSAYRQEGHALSINQHFYVFYPMPFYIAYPSHKKEIAERIQEGIETLHKTGKLKKINEEQLKYMHANYNKNARVYVLKNPFISDEMGKNITDSAINDYFPNNNNIEYLPEQVSLAK